MLSSAAASRSASTSAGASGSVTSPMPSRMIFASRLASANAATRRPISGNR